VLLNKTDKQNLVCQEDILKQLEDSDDRIKVRALKSAILMMLGGEPMPRILMTVIRFCINTEHHEFKKLLMLFWEIVPKYDSEKKLLPEMILVCNALRNDLNHSNEYVRGSMLRFLCKLREPEIIEPLVPSIKSCLSHRHSYVRKNAALAVYHIHKHHGPALVPDGADIMHDFIKAENEVGSRRNAFLMLFNEAEEFAIEFLATHADELDDFGDGFALLVLELTRKVCRRDPRQKSRFVRFLFQLLGSQSAAVSYEAAWTLVSLSSAPTAVRAAATTYTALLSMQSDNNVKLIVLERLAEMKKRQSRVLTEVLMDMLRALSSPNVDICKRTLEIAIDLVSPRNIEDVVNVLKREVVRTRDSNLEKGLEYRGMLIQAIHTCSLKHPEIAGSVVHVLMDFLGVDGGMDVIIFVRAIVEQNASLRSELVKKLVDTLCEIKSSSVLSVSLWIIGEYAEGEETLNLGFDEIMRAFGRPPYFTSQLSTGTEPPTGANARSLVLADGTYASQAGVAEQDTHAETGSNLALRTLISNGDFFLGTVAASSLAKLVLKTRVLHGEHSALTKQRQLIVLNLCCGLAELVGPSHKEDCLTRNSDNMLRPDTRDAVWVGASADCLERLALFARLLLDTGIQNGIIDAYLNDGKASFAQYLRHASNSKSKEESPQSMSTSALAQVDNLISWRQLRQVTSASGELDLCDGDDLMRATGSFETGDGIGTRLSHVYQLTGFADPVYAEAYVTVHDYDIILEILVINRTSSTLTNLTVELATMGDLKLVERPLSLTIGPLDQHSISANIKVSSTETGHIFGTIVYENSSNAEKTLINMNNIHLDIMDYIRPAVCSDEMFRAMWAEFEWENKVAISTAIDELGEFLKHIISMTNMCCLTPQSALGGTSSFLAANLYAKSIFGEDALVNVSVEKKDDADGKLSGYIRIRSKTQGIALSLGDRITAVQRNTNVSQVCQSP
jgi:coatomer subunit beta